MKVRTDCNSCRKRIHEEEKTEFLKAQYAIFTDMAECFAAYAVSSVLMTLVRRGRTKQYIQKMYEDMCFAFTTPEVMGREIRMNEIMKMLEKDYGIDWSKISVNCETEHEFISSTKAKEKERLRENA